MTDVVGIARMVPVADPAAQPVGTVSGGGRNPTSDRAQSAADGALAPRRSASPPM